MKIKSLMSKKIDGRLIILTKFFKWLTKKKKKGVLFWKFPQISKAPISLEEVRKKNRINFQKLRIGNILYSILFVFILFF